MFKTVLILFTFNEGNTEIEVFYIDNPVEGMYDLLEGKELHCEFEGTEAVYNDNGKYCYITVLHKVT